MKLSDYFSTSQIVNDGVFSTLGGVRTEYENTLAYADTPFHLKKLAAIKNVSCLIIKTNLVDELKDSSISFVVSPSPRDTFYELHEKLIVENNYSPMTESYIGEHCNIHKSAIISDNVHIGDNTTIGEKVVIRNNVYICSGSTIEPGSVIGAEGILYRIVNNKKIRIQHAGGVKIGVDATLLANSVIVKSVHPSIKTEVGARTIIGIASTIGHEVFIGEDCIISGNSVVARNAIIENECYLGSSTVVRENIKLGKGAIVYAGAIVVSDVAAGNKVSGNFAHSHFDRLREYSSKI